MYRLSAHNCSQSRPLFHMHFNVLTLFRVTHTHLRPWLPFHLHHFSISVSKRSNLPMNSLKFNYIIWTDNGINLTDGDDNKAEFKFHSFFGFIHIQIEISYLTSLRWPMWMGFFHSWKIELFVLFILIVHGKHESE